MKNVARRCVLKAPLLLIYTKYLSLIIGESPVKMKAQTRSSWPRHLSTIVYRCRGTSECAATTALNETVVAWSSSTPPPLETLCLVLRSQSGAADSFPAAREKKKKKTSGRLRRRKHLEKVKGHNCITPCKALITDRLLKVTEGQYKSSAPPRLGQRKKKRVLVSTIVSKDKVFLVAVAYAMQNQMVYFFHAAL